MCARLGLISASRAYEQKEMGEHVFTTDSSIARGRFGTKVYWVWVLTLVLMSWEGSFGLYCIMLMSFSTISDSRLDRLFRVRLTGECRLKWARLLWKRG